MGLEDEFKEAREFVEKELSLAPDRDQINLFECTIRVLGGFLSTYHLTKYVTPLFVFFTVINEILVTIYSKKKQLKSVIDYYQQ